MSIKCTNQGCGRYKINAIIDIARQAFSQYGLDLIEKIKINDGGNKIFV